MPQDYTYSIVSASHAVGKTLDAEGNKLETVTALKGDARCQVFIGTLAEFAWELQAMDNTQCLTTGVPKIADDCYLGVGEQAPGAMLDGVPYIQRSKDNFEFQDEPGFLFIDYDPSHWLGPPLETPRAVLDAVSEAFQVDIDTLDYAYKPSSSSYITSPVVCTGFRGMHLFVGVSSLAPLRDGGVKLLEQRLFARGFGSGYVSKAGRILFTSLVDAAPLKTPNSLIFCGKVTAPEGVTSNRQVEINHGGGMLDLRQLCSPLTIPESRQSQEAKARIKAGLSEEAAVVTETYIAERLEANPALTEEAVRRTLSGDGEPIPGSWMLVNNDWSQMPLWRAIIDPEPFLGEYMRDPVEPDYGASKALLNYSPTRGLRLVSFAHGKTTHETYLDLASFTEALKTPSAAERWRDWVPLVRGATPGEVRAAVVDSEIETGIDNRADLLAVIRGKMGAAIRTDFHNMPWDQLYVYLRSEAQFLALDSLEAYHGVVMVSERAFNATHADPWLDKAPAEIVVEDKLVPFYDSVTCQPAEYLNDSPLQHTHLYNTYRPGPKIMPDPDADVGPWLDLMRRLVPDPDEHALVLDWMAYTLQYPGRKINWQLLMYSAFGGVGKDTCLQPLEYGLGAHNCATITTTELLSDFNEYLMHAPCLLVLSELSGESAGWKVQNKLKPMAAAPPTQLGVNIKGVKRATVANTCSIVAMTNDPEPFKLDQGDRRWYMVECPSHALSEGQKREAAVFFKHLYAWYEQGGLHQVAQWLAARDVSAFPANEAPPMTEMKASVIEASKTNLEVIMEQYLADNDHIEVVSTDNLRSVFGAHGETVSDSQVAKTMRAIGWVKVAGMRKIEGKAFSARGYGRSDLDPEKWTARAIYDHLRPENVTDLPKK